MNAIKDRVLALISMSLNVDRDKLVDDARFLEDLGADTLDFVELMMEAEEEFGICVTEADAEKLTTVGSMVDYVKKQVSCPESDEVQS